MKCEEIDLPLVTVIDLFFCCLKKKITFSLLFCGAVGANGVFFYLRHLEMFLGGYIVSAHTVYTHEFFCCGPVVFQRQVCLFFVILKSFPRNACFN